jgi:hypothetical protein
MSKRSNQLVERIKSGQVNYDLLLSLLFSHALPICRRPRK